MARRWVAAALTLACSGCAGLPKDVDRPVSTAIDVVREPTALSALVAQQRRAAGARPASGFMLLSGPQEAYGSRLALVQGAQKTLDLQYYAIHADASSARLLQDVVLAARRGVRVRILLDDFHSTGRNALVMRLAFEPRIEMRMFNPVAGTRGSALGRAWGSLTDFSRVQQRMHNKLFIADNVMGVTGGRNLGDAYFGQGQAENFVDLDVLAVGPIVADMSRSFDTFWNNPRSYPVQSLITREELEKLREQVQRSDAEKEVDGESEGAGKAQPKAPVPEMVPPTAGTPAQGDSAHAARAWNEQPLDLRSARFTWAPAVMLADQPTKIALDGQAAQALAREDGPTEAGPAALPTATATATVPPPAAGPRVAAATEGEEETVVDGLLNLMAHTRRDLLIISPYFVPGEDMKRAFAEARSRGVRVRILTNSLASNDAPIAHVGYARHRKDLLDLGVELYELRSEQAGLRTAFGSSGAPARPAKKGANAGNEGASGGATGASRSMLHSKVMVVDRNLLVVGSMNLDLRSQLQNTEVALLIRSPALSQQAAQQIENAMRRGSWHVQRESDGALVWRAPEGSDLPDAYSDPDSSAGLRLLLRLLGPLAPDHLL
nr:phospholipase D family protein [Melaminivora sp.]